MTEYQTHAALVATLETEIVRLRAVNAELRARESTSLRQRADAWLAVCALLRELRPSWQEGPGSAQEQALEAIRAMAPQPAAVEQEPVTWIANEWSVFNTGAEVASGLSLNEAMDYLTDERAAREWSVVCVINKDNMPTPAHPPALEAQEPCTPDDMAHRPGGLSQSAAAEQEPVAVSRDQIREVFMAHGFTVKDGQTDLKQYVYDAAYALLARCAAPQPARQPLTDDWIRGMCKESWVFDAAKQWIRIAERAHGIGGEA